VVPFRLNGTQYFVAYKGGTGHVEIDKITGGGNSVATTEVWAGNWGKGWSHLVPMIHNGAVQMLRYKSTTGLASVEPWRRQRDRLGLVGLVEPGLGVRPFGPRPRLAAGA
jgi:hypothetical protein